MCPSVKAAAMSASDNSSTASGAGRAGEPLPPPEIRVYPFSSARFGLFQIALSFEALKIAGYAGDRQDAAAAKIRHGAIARFQRAVDVHGIQGFRVADIVDREIVVLAPEEGDRVKG